MAEVRGKGEMKTTREEQTYMTCGYTAAAIPYAQKARRAGKALELQTPGTRYWKPCRVYSSNTNLPANSDSGEPYA